ncbi:MAG: hypothetical protein CEN87_402 [Parcubacteria group bacterium Licking1014_1]|nr:MAG: hypothetical protein CEN87_402 [Parcubacteria group bacterium Licking1014_1]
MTTDHDKNPRIIIPDLKELGKRLKKVDHHLVALLAKRTILAKQVQERKRIDGNQPIIRLETEEQRLSDVRKWADRRGVNPTFAESIFYFIIAESCRVQIDHLQANTGEIEKLRKANKEEFYKILKNNLLALTAETASSHDDNYGASADYATALYMKFEDEAINREIDTLRSLNNLDLALDLGCATGRIAFMVAPHFAKTIGIDISPQMIDESYKKNIPGDNSIEFREFDLENGIPVENESASLVVMNLGTASDIRDIKRMVAATKRVLKKDGRFAFSFYNAGALLYRWSVPWPPSLTAEINMDTHCLNVRIRDKLFTVHARPYSVREIKKLFTGNGLSIGSIKTYPTITPILPSEFFDEQDPEKINEMESIAKELEYRLADLEKGAYILVTGRKN